MNPREVAVRICLRAAPSASITVDGKQVSRDQVFDYLEPKHKITFHIPPMKQQAM